MKISYVPTLSLLATTATLVVVPSFASRIANDAVVVDGVVSNGVLAEAAVAVPEAIVDDWEDEENEEEYDDIADFVGRDLKGKDSKGGKSTKKGDSSSSSKGSSKGSKGGKGKGKARASSSCTTLDFWIQTQDVPVNQTAYQVDIIQKVNGKVKTTGTLFQADLGCLIEGAFSFRNGKRQLFYSGTCLTTDAQPIYAGSGAYAGAEGTWTITKSGSRKTKYVAEFCT